MGSDSYTKYLLKGEFKDRVELIHSHGKAEWTHNGTLSLQDKKDTNIFTVTIHNLTLKDIGIYMCAVNIFGTYYLTKVKLVVLSCVKYEEITVTGYEGANAVISCPYQKGYESYPKYLLKGECKDGVEIIRSTDGQEWTLKEKFSLQDKNNFTATIRNLTVKDAGIYGCGVDKQGTYFFTRTKLIVGTSTTPASEFENTTDFLADTRSASSAQRPSTPQSSTGKSKPSAADSKKPNTTQSDAVYQSLNPNTIQPDAVYQSLNPNSTQSDAAYQSLNPKMDGGVWRG
ncbi:CMRF35-like molecule 6 [Sardina pilchardus]|uniref:CMRF35-like molecule 6 n=1 Tax=Sardina pilchardus TaxID=27697 RepID=UPI002E123470